MRELVKTRLLNKDLNSGVKSTFFSWFNRTLKGFRKGEFTIFTGPTGSGKTTFLSQLSLDFAKSGVPTLWCSFELKNEVLLSTMLNQFAGRDLQREPNRFDYFADQFENIPLYFQTYFGSTHVDDVTTMIDYAIYTHDVGHVIIDNLQFMLSGQAKGIERFEMQDEVISKLRHLSTTHNVHITLVIHPRKGEDGQDLNVSSVFGTAKSTQEADNVLILQQRDKYRVIDVKKNRFDGEVGKSSLWFDKNSKRFEQISAKEIEELLTGAKIEDIISRKGREIKEEMSLINDPAALAAAEVQINSSKHPDSETTNEQLQKQLDLKFGPQKEQKKHFYKAFTKLSIGPDSVRSFAIKQQNIQPINSLSEEPTETEVEQEEIITNSVVIVKSVENNQTVVYSSTETSHLNPSIITNQVETDQPIQQSLQPTSASSDNLVEEYDPFEIKFEGDYNQIDISVRVDKIQNQGTIEAEDVEVFVDFTKPPKIENYNTISNNGKISGLRKNTAAGQSHPNNNTSEAFKDVLVGLQGAVDPPKYLDNVYQEGEVVATYDDMVEELLANNKYRRKGTSQGQHFTKYPAKDERESKSQTKMRVVDNKNAKTNSTGHNKDN